MYLFMNDFTRMFICCCCSLFFFMIGVNVWRVYLAPQNIPSATGLTPGNKVVLYCFFAFVELKYLCASLSINGRYSFSLLEWNSFFFFFLLLGKCLLFAIILNKIFASGSWTWTGVCDWVNTNYYLIRENEDMDWKGIHVNFLHTHYMFTTRCDLQPFRNRHWSQHSQWFIGSFLRS